MNSTMMSYDKFHKVICTGTAKQIVYHIRRGTLIDINSKSEVVPIRFTVLKAIMKYVRGDAEHIEEIKKFIENYEKLGV